MKDVADALQIEAGILFFLDEFSIPPIEQNEVRGSVDSIAVSADGQTAATASGAISPGILIQDLVSRMQKGRIPGVRSVVRLSFTRNGKFLVSSGITDPEVGFWWMNGNGSGRAVVAREWQPFPIPGRSYSVARNPTKRRIYCRLRPRRTATLVGPA